MRIGSVTSFGVATVGLIALTIGLYAGLPLVYLLSGVALLCVVWMWSAWNESRLPDTDEVAPRGPVYWFLVALAYTLTAVAVGAFAWWYL